MKSTVKARPFIGKDCFCQRVIVKETDSVGGYFKEIPFIICSIGGTNDVEAEIVERIANLPGCCLPTSQVSFRIGSFFSKNAVIIISEKHPHESAAKVIGLKVISVFRNIVV